jgi:hypothetical protein
MTKIFMAVMGLTFAGAVYANCTTHTVNSGGKFIMCTTCCYNGNCNTTCF